jgi:hypothetical protein
MRGLSQFVAGLGPRKAAALRTGISQVIHDAHGLVHAYIYYTYMCSVSCTCLLYALVHHFNLHASPPQGLGGVVSP